MAFNNYYTGVGSRTTPEHILCLMRQIGEKLANHGIIGRSGSADGADLAFEKGFYSSASSQNKTLFESYLPWDGFNGYWFDDIHTPAPIIQNYQDAITIARTIHPIFDKLSPAVKKLHTRNVYQVLGLDLNTPSSILICYAKPTKTGVSGGTNTAWALANMHNIPCYNLWYAADLQNLIFHLGIEY